MAFLNPPPADGIHTATGVAATWRNFFVQAYRLLLAMQASGVTADRPVTLLWIGRPFFDTTLGYAIWWDGAQWVDSAGAPA